MSSLAATTAKPLRIGMLGAGTVGGGVYELIMGKTRKDEKTTDSSSNNNVVISKICVRSIDKPRDFQIHNDVTQLTTDVKDLLNDDIDCLVEVAGGCGVAKEAVLSALQSGKTVVTANKALLAEYMAPVEQAAATSATLGYEAAVCGGIPIIDLLRTCYQGDCIQKIMGICNGTTNYMLSAMAADTSVNYAEILKEAQDLGFAEADPTADVEGHDVRAKISILAKLAFGRTVSVDQIPCTGISSITATDFAMAKENQCTIKLLGTAALNEDKQLSVYVTPAMVPLSHGLATIQGCGNCVSVTSENLGTCNYTGPGAGRFPTANSVVADIYRAASNTLPAEAFAKPRAAANEIVSDYSSSFFVRIPCQGGTSTKLMTALGGLAQEHGIVVLAMQQKQADELTQVTLTTSETCLRSAVEKFCQAAQQQLDVVTESPLCMPILAAE